MNYVGQLAETVYVTVKELYEGLNPATLSGGSDVLVVRQPDGSFVCSPFHVRFGKLSVLRSREKVVDIEINGKPVDLQMKLGDDGQAFFVQQLEANEEEVPTSLRTSPIPVENSNEILSDPLLDLIEDVHRKTSQMAIPLRKKRRCRKKAKKKSKVVPATTPNSSSEELEGIQSEIVLKVKPATESSSASFSPDGNVSAQPNDSNLYLDVTRPEDNFFTADDTFVESKDPFVFFDVECLLKESHSGSLSSEYLTSFKSDSELEMAYADQNPTRTGSHVQWPWGSLPQVMKGENVKVLGPSHSNISTKPHLWEEPIFQRSSFHKLAESQTVLQDAKGISSSPSLLHPPASFQSSRPSDVTKSCFIARKLTAARDSLAQDKEENMAENTQEMRCSSGSIMSAKGPTVQEGSDPSGQSEEDKETQRSSQHLGPSDIHLEDLPSSSSTNTTLYLTQSEIGLEAKLWSEPFGSDTNLSTTTTVKDSNTDSLSDTALEQGNDVKLSLCGGLADNQDISIEKFTKYAISYQDLADNPGILYDPNLVVKIGMKHYNWAVAAPMILSLQAFQKSLPKSTIDKLVKEKMPKKSGRWWFSWGLKDPITEEHEIQEMASTSKKNSIQQVLNMDVSSIEVNSLSTPVVLNAPSPPPQSHISAFKKSLRLSSDQIFQGTCHCHANIYLWNWYDKVVISDIDGTITKSDALGHILPQLGKDWTHQGIIKLYHKIHLNGYKFLYCSTRSIGMADLTRSYLQWVNEQGCALPKGPLLLTPSSLFSALHREMIEKKPEVFKIACLTDIHHLFLPHRNPFFAGFGNRATVSVPSPHLLSRARPGRVRSLLPSSPTSLCSSPGYLYLSSGRDTQIPNLHCQPPRRAYSGAYQEPQDHVSVTLKSEPDCLVHPPHRTDGETQAQGARRTHSRSHREQVSGVEFEPSSSDSRASILYTVLWQLDGTWNRTPGWELRSPEFKSSLRHLLPM
ncbi:phosphatidate phosphatase LPIN3 isoform X3 [Trichosurus vulpecula]|uniref:phosphatidate phosphatase LPIN3 isoform X3 n=1 Tax=Trichosurus vulpecula TaxID=9337 RepID=UPI00186AD073|nr:phosphatidate phosphatase LPIN3 isoform X3 [Trichosurus vulpecula]